MREGEDMRPLNVGHSCTSSVLIWKKITNTVPLQIILELYKCGDLLPLSNDNLHICLMKGHTTLIYHFVSSSLINIFSTFVRKV